MGGKVKGGQGTGDRGQGPGARGQGTGDRGQGTGDRKQETGNRKQKDMAVQSVKELEVYKKSYSLAMEIFKVSKRFPPEERWALTGQIRRSSRSVCNNLRGAWAKRRYDAHFVSKLTDCDGENGETDTSLDFAGDCEYITHEEHSRLVAMNAEVGRMLGSMLKNPEPFLLRPKD
jgi:four helix bundle protein